MRKKEKMIAARVSEKLLTALDLEVKNARYLNVSRSEMIETLLEMVFTLPRNERKKVFETVRSRVIKKRKGEKEEGDKPKCL